MLSRRRIAAATLVGALALAGAACSSETPGGGGRFAAGTTMDRLNKAGAITIGTKYDQPGFGLKGLDGKPAGFDVEIGKIIATELGIPVDKINWVETKSAVREEVIEKGDVDIVVATYTINDRRKERVAFAGPYYVAGQSIMVNVSDTSITGPDTFLAGTKKICSVQGSTSAANIEKYLKDKAAQLVLFDIYQKCIDAMKAGQVDAVTSDNVVLLGFVATNEGLFKLTGSTFTQEPYGIGVKKDDTAFREFLNQTLEKIFSDGRYAQAWRDTAGKFDPILPPPPTINRYS